MSDCKTKSVSDAILEKMVADLKTAITAELLAEKQKTIEDLTARLAELEASNSALATELKSMPGKEIDRKALDGYVAKFHTIINDTKPERSHLMSGNTEMWSLWEISLSSLGVPQGQRTYALAAAIREQVELSSSKNRKFTIRADGVLYEGGYVKWVVSFTVQLTNVVPRFDN